jgi:hypothetical protein
MRAKVPDNEVATVVLVAAKYFANNQRIALGVMQRPPRAMSPVRRMSARWPRPCGRTDDRSQG